MNTQTGTKLLPADPGQQEIAAEKGNGNRFSLVINCPLPSTLTPAGELTEKPENWDVYWFASYE